MRGDLRLGLLARLAAQRRMHDILSNVARRGHLPGRSAEVAEVDIVASPTKSRPTTATKSAKSRGDAMAATRGDKGRREFERARMARRAASCGRSPKFVTPQHLAAGMAS